MRHLTSLFASVSLSALVGLAASSAAIAQVTPGAPAPALEEVVVTAQKRTEALQDVPISMEVVSGKQLEAFQTSTFEALQNYVPNLLVQPSPGPQAIFIRGIGSQSTNSGFDQSVSLYVDGIYGGRIRQFMAPFFDVERVEVLRGPQGALVGKNTAAGAISIVTSGPTPTFHAGATGSYNFSRPGGELFGYVSGPITDTLSARLAVKYSKLDGYIENTATGHDDPRLRTALARLSVRYAPSDHYSAIVRVDAGESETLGTSQVRVDRLNPKLDDRKAAEAPFGNPERNYQRSQNASITQDIGLGEHTLTLITGYSHFKAKQNTSGGVGTPETFAPLYRERFEQKSQEVRLTSPEGKKLEYILGGYYDDGLYHLKFQSRYNLAGGLLNGLTTIHFDQHQTTASVFGQATYHLTDELRVLGSLRYTENRKTGYYRQVQDFGRPLGPLGVPTTRKIRESNTDPSFTLQYDVTEDVMLYATYGSGSKSGGFVSNQRGLQPAGFVFGPETSENYEVGAKGYLFDRRLMLELAIYDTKFKDLQVSSYDPIQLTFVTRNAARATSKGVEGSLEWRVSNDFRLAASAAYLDATYDDFPGAPCLATSGPTCVPATNNLKGVTVPGASKYTGNIQGTYERPIADGLLLTATGIVSFRSAFFTASDLSPTYGHQDGYAKLDARLEISNPDKRWSLALIGKNLTNELTHSFSYLWPLVSPPVGIQFLDETRTVSIEGSVKF